MTININKNVMKIKKKTRENFNDAPFQNYNSYTNILSLTFTVSAYAI